MVIVPESENKHAVSPTRRTDSARSSGEKPATFKHRKRGAETNVNDYKCKCACVSNPTYISTDSFMESVPPPHYVVPRILPIWTRYPTSLITNNPCSTLSTEYSDIERRRAAEYDEIYHTRWSIECGASVGGWVSG